MRISGDFDIPVGLKTRKVFSLAAKIISSQFYQTQRLVLCHTSCTMREPLTQTFLPHSAPLQHNKPTSHRQWQMHVMNPYITLPHTQIQVFDTKCATWYCQYTQMCPTFPNQVVKVERQDISTSPITMTKTSTMAPYSPC